MIVARIVGGLGNQLFQYSYAASLSKKYNTELYLDTSDLDQDLNREYMLDAFHISGKKVPSNLKFEIINAQKKYPIFVNRLRKMMSMAVKLHNIVSDVNDTYFNATKLAIEYIEKETKKSVNLVFFSDDIENIKGELNSLKRPSLFVNLGKGIKDSEELKLMAKCDHNIIANSSFSWWGAWLNNNPDKIVVGPNPWFRDNSNKHIMPDGWVKIQRDLNEND